MVEDRTRSSATLARRPRTRPLGLVLRGSLVIFLSASLVLLAGPARHASAYALEGCSWNFNNPTLVLGSDPHYAAVADSAASSWNYQLYNNNVGLQWNIQPYGASGQVYEHEYNFGNTGYDGITFYSCSDGYYFDTPVNSYFNTYYTNGYSYGEAQAVITHEFGHALGLAHNPTFGGCSYAPIMYYMATLTYIDCGYVGPRPDDIAGARAIYP